MNDPTCDKFLMAIRDTMDVLSGALLGRNHRAASIRRAGAARLSCISLDIFDTSSGGCSPKLGYKPETQ